MKMHGGYLPRIAGEPAGNVRTLPVPDMLRLETVQQGLNYTVAVEDGQQVEFGGPLAWAEVTGGRIALPAPAAGTVQIKRGGRNTAAQLLLKVADSAAKAVSDPRKPETISAADMRQALAESGVWALLWSSRTDSVPPLDGSEIPGRIIVSSVSIEPFKPTAEVLWPKQTAKLVSGLHFLRQLLPADGVIHFIADKRNSKRLPELTEAMNTQPWFKLENMPVRYPAGHPRVLCRCLRQADSRLEGSTPVWALDLQALQALNACLSEGLPLHERVLAVGGPGAAAPGYVRARLGTALEQILAPADLSSANLPLRGGLFQGVPVAAAETDSVNLADDAFFVLPRPGQRELLGFINPGFDRVSILSCFVSFLTGAADRNLNSSTRGERRPCVACGLCEQVCPLSLLPQVMHRNLYRNAFEEAERGGLGLCIGCGLCSYVCPSKLDLREEFTRAQEQLRLEREHAAAAV